MFCYKASPAARKFTLRMGFALALAASMTGCAVGPKYHRPTVNAAAVSQRALNRTRTSSLRHRRSTSGGRVSVILS